MRNILFRGKTIIRGRHFNINKWEYGAYIPIDKVIRTEYMSHCVEPETVGQSIEMHDRHNTLVFENDIVEFVCGSTSSRYLIWWNHEMSMMTAVPLDGIYFNGHDYRNGNYPNFNYSTFCLMMQDPWGDFSDIRVIGNIHDNPELLEGCKNYARL